LYYFSSEFSKTKEEFSDTLLGETGTHTMLRTIDMDLKRVEAVVKKYGLNLIISTPK
jgi:hypothetical protein